MRGYNFVWGRCGSNLPISPGVLIQIIIQKRLNYDDVKNLQATVKCVPGNKFEFMEIGKCYLKINVTVCLRQIHKCTVILGSGSARQLFPGIKLLYLLGN